MTTHAKLNIITHPEKESMPIFLWKEPYKLLLQINNSNLGYLLQEDFIINMNKYAAFQFSVFSISFLFYFVFVLF